MSARRPAARTSAARDNVAFSDIYRPGSLERIRAQIPSESLHAIDHQSGISWLEWEHDHWLMDGTLNLLGKDDAIDCWRQSIAYLIEKPLLKNFVDSGLRLFGAKPGTLVKLLPKGWTLAYRDFCVPRFEKLDEQSAVVHFEQVAPEAFESPGYLHCWHGTCLGIFDLGKPSEGQVDFEIDEPAAVARAIFRWS